jgi:hypothetical protein
MTATTTLSTPLEVDSKLADLYEAHARIDSKLDSLRSTILGMADAKYYYRGRRRVTDMTEEEAVEILSANRDGRNVRYGMQTNGEVLDRLDAEYEKAFESLEEIGSVQKLYTGWSRFFVVTSSNGHIHSSTHCSTCRPTTTYGWLPNLSGKTEAEAIAFFGVAAECLCSVCFPNAPTKDRNLTAKEREDLLAGRTPEAKPEKTYCPGSGSYGAQPSRQGYCAGNYATCSHCGSRVTTTTRNSMKLRKHEAATS